MPEYSYAERLKCTRCGAEHPLEYVLVCSKCGSLLEIEYDLKEVAKLDFEKLAVAAGKATGGIWRFHPVLPVKSPEHTVTLGEGNTPLIPCLRYGAELG